MVRADQHLYATSFFHSSVLALFALWLLQPVSLQNNNFAGNFRHRLCRRQAALHGTYGAPRPQMSCP